MGGQATYAAVVSVKDGRGDLVVADAECESAKENAADL